METGKQEDFRLFGEVGERGGDPTIPQPGYGLGIGSKFSRKYEGLHRTIGHHQPMGEGRNTDIKFVSSCFDD